MRHIAIIGSTGSIGTQALSVVRAFPQEFCVTALTAHSNLALLKEQVEEFHPQVVGVSSPQCYAQAKELFPNLTLLCGEEAHAQALEAPRTDTSLISVVGFSGLRPLLRSIELKLHTCVANKESIVCGGEAVRALLQRTGQRIYPVDSEHSAIFQCLDGHEGQNISRILLTCSGGAFCDCDKTKIACATVEQALKHPNWSMGKKITIDSATLANKGLEVLEARWLFDVPIEKIEVVVHPQSIVHSMVEFSDRSVLAQMGYPDMRLPIQIALAYPQRLQQGAQPMDFASLGALTFHAPDVERFPCLALAYEAGRMGGAAPVAFNAANDLAVAAYAEKKIGFYDIPRWIERAMHRFGGGKTLSIDEIFEMDAQVRAYICEE